MPRPFTALWPTIPQDRAYESIVSPSLTLASSFPSPTINSWFSHFSSMADILCWFHVEDFLNKYQLLPRCLSPKNQTLFFSNNYLILLSQSDSSEALNELNWIEATNLGQSYMKFLNNFFYIFKTKSTKPTMFFLKGLKNFISLFWYLSEKFYFLKENQLLKQRNVYEYTNGCLKQIKK